MQQIIQIRPLTLKETALARTLKPFEDKNMVTVIEDEFEMFEFIIDITQDRGIDSENFEHLTLKTDGNMTPKRLYQHLVDGDEYVPALYLAHTYTDGSGYIHYKNIYGIKEYKDMQSFIFAMTSKGVIQGQYLLKGPENKEYSLEAGFDDED